jgi:hypothetical protein
MNEAMESASQILAILDAACDSFCCPMLDWTRQANLAEWDELGAGD